MGPYISIPARWTVLLPSLFDNASSYSVSSCTEYLPVHSRFATPNVVSRRFPTLVFLVYPYVCSVALSTNAQKHTENPENPTHCLSCSVVYSPPPWCSPRSSTSSLHPSSPVATKLPRTSFIAAPLLVARFVHVGSLCDIDSPVSPTSQVTVLLLACICQSIGDRYVEQTRRLRAIICKLNGISLELLSSTFL